MNPQNYDSVLFIFPSFIGLNFVHTKNLFAILSNAVMRFQINHL